MNSDRPVVRSSGRPVVDVRRSDCTDPIAAFVAAAPGRRILWWDGEHDWLLAEGSAWEETVDGPGRCVHAAAAQARFWATASITAPAEAPVEVVRLMTALSFEDRAPGPSHWGAALPGLRLWLPARCTVAMAGGTWTSSAPAMMLPTEPDAAWAPLPVSDFATLVEDAVDLLRDGALRKVVLARAVDLPTTADLTDILRRLATAPGLGTVYAIDVPGGVFLGRSPERLFRVNGDQLATMALAGSASGPGAAGRLLASTKERKEHNLVVEHVVTALRPRCAPFAVPESPTPLDLGRLVHLFTPINATVLRPDWFDLIQALHPTPAVCGLPTATAAHYVARREKLHRGLYTGVLGWCARNAADCLVPLRGGILRTGSCRCFAGAGIVETSDPAAELAETEVKFGAMRAVL